MVYTQGIVEYRGTGPAGPSFSYPALEKYNLPTNDPRGKNGSTGNPYVGPNNSTSMSYVVPEFRAITYDALTHGQGPTTGYFNVTNAYGAGASNCNTQYRIRMIDQ